MPDFRRSVVKLIPAKVARIGKYLSSLLSPSETRNDAPRSTSRFTDQGQAFLKAKVTTDQIKNFLAGTPGIRSGRSAQFIKNFITGVRNFVEQNVDRIRRRNDRLADPTKVFERALEKAVESARHDIQSLARNLIAGKITVPQFREALVARIRRLHLESAMLGLEGIGNMTPNIPEVVNRRISQQIRFIDEAIATAIRGDNANGEVGQRFVSRSGIFAGAGRVTAQQVQRQALSDFSQINDQKIWERRILGKENNCPECPEYADAGWQPIGTLPAIGQGSSCGANCGCRFIYFFGPEPSDDVGL